MNAHVDEHAQHAVYAPSSAHRWTVCTASAQAIAALGEQEEGEEAAEGTAAHDEIERILGPLCHSHMSKPDPVPYPESNDLDPEHPAAYGIALVVDFVRHLVKSHSVDSKLWIEQRVRLTDQIWGRCDVAHWDEQSKTLTIVDYKNGFVGVDAEENEQLRIYGAASIYTHKLPAKWIRYAVVQPNDFRPVPRVKQWVESAETLYEWANKTAAIPYGKLEFVGVGEHCRDCPLFGLCEPSKDVLLNLSQALSKPAVEVNDRQVAAFMAAKKPLEHFFEALTKAKVARAVAGTTPPGTKLVLPSVKRAWIPAAEPDLKKRLLAEHGLDSLALPTPAAVEKLGIDVSKLAETPKVPPTLALASDRRPEWKPKSVEQMFKGVPGVGA